MPEKTTTGSLFFLLLILCLASNSQDTELPAVHEEAFHQPVFENDFLRVMAVSAANGDTTDFHRHCLPIVYITVQGTLVELNEPDESWKQVELPTGWIGHDLYDSNSCYTHRFAISGSQNLQIIAVEGLNYSGKPDIKANPIYEQGGFTVYQIELSNAEIVKALNVPVILVGESGNDQLALRVIDSKLLSKRLLENQLAYVVFFYAQEEKKAPKKSNDSNANQVLPY